MGCENTVALRQLGPMDDIRASGVLRWRGYRPFKGESGL